MRRRGLTKFEKVQTRNALYLGGEDRELTLRISQADGVYEAFLVQQAMEAAEALRRKVRKAVA